MAGDFEVEQDRAPDVLPHHRELRGRPLTSYQVVLETIAATTTKTGLTIGAELDTGSYDLGISVTPAEFHALPITPNAFHGDWNYTLSPVPPRAPDAPTTTHRTDPALTAMLTDPALTGMDHDHWEELIGELAAARTAQREEDLHQRRGGDRQKTPTAGLYTGQRPGLTLVDRLLATLLHERFRLPQVAIARLFAVAPQTVNRRIRKTHQVLDEIRHTIPPAEHRLATLDELADLATHLGITPTSENKTTS